MSEQDQGVFAHIQLRSSTPAPNEKVLTFLMGMQDDRPNNTPPRSMADPDEYASKAGSINSGTRTPQQLFSPAPRSKISDILLDPPLSRNGLKAPSHIEEVDERDDVNSNVQVGTRSELGEMPVREPGPHDPPGPKYASYDSGPSFGNFGPLPTDEHPTASINLYANNSWNPQWANIINNGDGNGEAWNNGASGNPTGLTEGGLSAYPAGLTSGPPASERGGTPRQGSVILDARAPSRASPSKASERDLTTSPRPPSRVQSKAPTDQPPWSPFSGRSKLTRPTDKGIPYPPLPESRMGDHDIGSPQSRARSAKVPSISPSDSPSGSGSPRVQLFAQRGPYSNGHMSPPPGSVLSGGMAPGGHHNRAFSPYRHAPTQEDLLNAALRGRALVIPNSPEPKAPSVISKSPSKQGTPKSPQSRALSQMEGGKPISEVSRSKHSSIAGSRISHVGSRAEREQQDLTPTPSRPQSPDGLDPEEARMVNDALASRIVDDALAAARTPRTSYYAASLEPEATSHYHDMELCVLLHQENDPSQHEIVKKALRKAVRQRIKKLGMKYDHESIKQYRKSYHDHDPSVHMRPEYSNDEPPQWASDLKREIVLMQQRIESLGPKIEGLKSQDRSFIANGSRFAYEPDESTRTPMTQTVNIQTQPTGTLADSMYQPAEEEDVFLDEDGNPVQEWENKTETDMPRRLYTDGETRSQARSEPPEVTKDDSTGQQYLEEQLYKLREKPQGSQSDLRSHQSWEVAQHDEMDDIYEEDRGLPQSGLPTIPDTNADVYHDDRSNSPPLPELPKDDHEMTVHPQGPWNTVEYSGEAPPLPPWQRIHARLLNWAIIWPMSELEQALNSTTRGQQVDEVALSIWSTQAYKRYVRARLTESPQGVVDRLFVPPNMADAISNAVFNGRHGDACGMLKDLWGPFGLDGMPRLIVVLAKHRSDPNHWVVHRFSLPEGALTTYDSYPERTLPDGRPLGWWFAIRVAWPNAMYPSPDHLVQKMVRLHRPMQPPIDNSVAAAGIWRNVLMGSRAERSVDLERLRDLINTEVKNLKQRKHLGKLSIGVTRPAWEDMS
ncbi:hypothetical protein HYPSUDRAFT_838373 [Hypholoma sublateritium FD-334 SS-4]|uniref:Uncharacterized protein n=1 Tax=Hypholoma sublateritium (strain FD-334 SS-4) TaxID=945553 RepID=A0A0D2PJA6_HYPSF|nr:hypothetical protein HYPSUDRAFT_838373 [Hypholoma sublateritium FD-334 SS-4]